MINRCPHGVYDPHNDQKYCSVCNPVVVSGDVKIEELPIGKVGEITIQPTDSESKTWEKKLNLEILAPENDEEFVPTPDDFEPRPVHKVSDNHPDFQQLREKMDGSEPFMTWGHQIKKIRAHDRKVPERMATLEGLKVVLEETFPNWKMNETQRKRISRWLYVAYLTYFVGLSQTQIAQEMQLKPETVKLVLQRLRRVALGIRADNTGPKKT